MGGLIRLLVLVVVVVKFWWLILLMLVVGVAGFWLWGVATRQDAERARQHREHAALVARADEQHAWILVGDDRGVHGDYPPDDLFRVNPDK